MNVPMDNLTLVHARVGSDVLEKVWDLYRKNSGTLGFLPRGALDEFAHAGRVIAAISSDGLLGYLAWRLSKGEVVIVHLCVAEEYRRTNCADLLLSKLIEECEDARALRLRCRKDYVAANRLWPKHGFVVVDETVGRGADAAPLFLWRRANKSDAPLLQAINHASPRAGRVVAVDANVFFDMMSFGAAHHSESSALLASWIDDVEICVTCEIRNEISRNDDPKLRQDAAAYVGRFREIGAPAEDLERAVGVVSRSLPAPGTDSDYSDRRQLAHAWIGGANFFATRDGALLDHAEELHVITNLIILRPSEIVARLEGDSLGNDYAPVRLHGTKVERRSPSAEVELHPFQLFSAYEEKADWLRLIRTALCAPKSFSIELLGEKGGLPRVAIAIDKSAPDELRVHFLRALSGSLTGTLLRRVISDVVESARHDGRRRVIFDDKMSKEVERAIMDLEFHRAIDGSFVRHTLPLVLDDLTSVDAVISGCIEGSRESGVDVARLEARFWPLKILNEALPCYIIPILPHWAASLFDSDLADRDLFGVPIRPALSLENVYYSASRVSIPQHSRVVWYVSGEIGQVRAVSACLGTDIGTASDLSRRFHRFGAYKWSEILAAARGDYSKELRAYRFARTELVVNPMGWSELQDRFIFYRGSKNNLQSPVKIPEVLFADIYRQTMGVSA